MKEIRYTISYSENFCDSISLSVPARLWQRYVSYQCCGSRIFISDPGAKFFHPGSRIRIKEFKYLNPKNWFLSTWKYDSGCSSRIWIPDPDPDPDLLSIQDPGVKKAPDPGYGSGYWFLRFRFRNTEGVKKSCCCSPDNDGRCQSP